MERTMKLLEPDRDNRSLPPSGVQLDGREVRIAHVGARFRVSTRVLMAATCSKSFALAAVCSFYAGDSYSNQKGEPNDRQSDSIPQG
jgi:hypothetical protein